MFKRYFLCFLTLVGISFLPLLQTAAAPLQKINGIKEEVKKALSKQAKNNEKPFSFPEITFIRPEITFTQACPPRSIAITQQIVEGALLNQGTFALNQRGKTYCFQEDIIISRDIIDRVRLQRTDPDMIIFTNQEDDITLDLNGFRLGSDAFFQRNERSPDLIYILNENHMNLHVIGGIIANDIDSSVFTTGIELRNKNSLRIGRHLIQGIIFRNIDSPLLNYGSQGLTVRRCVFEKSSSDDISILHWDVWSASFEDAPIPHTRSSRAQTVIEDNDFRGPGGGIEIKKNLHPVLIQQNTADLRMEWNYVISMDEAYRVTISDNNFATTLSAIRIFPAGTQHVRILRNHLKGPWIPIYISHSNQDIYIFGNTIELDHVTPIPSHIDLADGPIMAILLSAAQRISVINNQFIGFQRGITLYGSAARTFYRGNHFCGVQQLYLYDDYAHGAVELTATHNQVPGLSIFHTYNNSCP